DRTTFSVTNGVDGRGVNTIRRSAAGALADTYLITYTDGTASSFTVVSGSQAAASSAGAAASEGETIEDGETPLSGGLESPNTSGIADARINDAGYLVITMGDGVTINAGRVIDTEEIEYREQAENTRTLALVGFIIACVSLAGNLAAAANYIIKKATGGE
ncbi:MAG: hypothetical protein Q4B42_03090, partial [Oscillospiraceae bacterium]|nr:hypothetical protein [Oscillospiraceae bacterium]